MAHLSRRLLLNGGGRLRISCYWAVLLVLGFQTFYLLLTIFAELSFCYFLHYFQYLCCAHQGETGRNWSVPSSLNWKSLKYSFSLIKWRWIFIFPICQWEELRYRTLCYLFKVRKWASGSRNSKLHLSGLKEKFLFTLCLSLHVEPV